MKKAVPTYGLTHLALGVCDPERAFEFYRKVFGMVAVYRDPDFIQAQTPGTRDVLVFERTRRRTGTTGSIAHFGFRLIDPARIDDAIAAVRRAGGRVIETGEFCPANRTSSCRIRTAMLWRSGTSCRRPSIPLPESAGQHKRIDGQRKARSAHLSSPSYLSNPSYRRGLHSLLRATTGATRVARRAGTNVANIETSTTSAATEM